MKLSHLALLLTAGLLAYTAYLSLQSRESINEKIEAITAKSEAQEKKAAEEQDRLKKFYDDQLRLAEETNRELEKKNAGILAASLKEKEEKELAKAEADVVAAGASKAIADAAAGGGEPGELTPQQQKIKEAQSIGEVADYEAEYGFVVINCGANRGLTPGMEFVVRRNYFVVGKVKVDSVEEDEAIANVARGSVPIGFTIRKGDSVILAADAGIF